MGDRRLQTVLVTDCGSTTTKALLFERKQSRWQLTFRGEAPTTVENPIADVTVGALNAFRELEEVSGRLFLKKTIKLNEQPFVLDSKDPTQGIDLYLSTSSAGGGLQMLVAGIVGNLSASSAARAALGAGAIVLGTISFDDHLEDYEKINQIRHLKPDIFLLAGGFESGAVDQVIELAEILLAAAPTPRFGKTLKLPVIYAGNKVALPDVQKILQPLASFTAVENLRPSYLDENLIPTREAVHELFLTHVMSHSPGYDRLLTWTPEPILPTPSAVGKIIKTYAERSNQNILAVDIGGATTDVFSVFLSQGEYVFNRTVSANLGMSYSVANVLKEAGLKNIMRWLDKVQDPDEVINRIRNKMIRPTSIPQAQDDLFLEQAICREALRLSLLHHKHLAIGVNQQVQKKGIANIFNQRSSKIELVDMMALDLVIGSGGVISHAPDRMQAAMMMQDGFALKGLTKITVDSIFMLPHLGVFAEVAPAAAEEIFLNDCLVHVAHSITPVAKHQKGLGLNLASIQINDRHPIQIVKGEVKVVPLGKGDSYRLTVIPNNKLIDVGAGYGEMLDVNIVAGESGLILDGRLLSV